MSDYNGWKNYSTWSVFSTIYNTEELYKEFTDQSDLYIQDVFTQLLGDGTGDDPVLSHIYRTVDLTQVDWTAIADGLNLNIKLKG